LKGQKRSQEAENPANHIPTEGHQKRLRLLASASRRQKFDQEAASGLSASRCSHISHWAQQDQVWPDEFFEEDKMHRLLAKKKSSTASLRRKRSEASIITSTTPSDLQAEKSAPYKNPSYEAVLEREAGSYMDKYKPGVTEASERLCQTLLDSKQVIPQDTIFGDDVFDDTCQRLRGKNEARIFKDCTPLIVPWVEAHATLSANRNLDIAIESVNEGWNNSNPITKPRPQPDYAIGFRRSAFSEDQLKKLQPYLGDPSSSSYFMGTYYMHFPFFTCEVKCGSAGLDIADRQNLHSMTLAVRGIVELFRLANRAEELHREVLAFSVSHDHETVRIYGHFPVIEGTKTTYWRVPLRKYDFTERRGIEKWTAYTFMKNVYDMWMPTYFKRISSAIDELPPEHDFELSHASEPQISEASGLSQQLENQNLAEVLDSQLSHVDLQQITPITPDTSTQAEKPAPKKKKEKV
jgi:hypothetical protein